LNRIIFLSTVVVFLTATLLALSALAVGAQDYSGQYASDVQYGSAAGQEAGCGWYWGYRFYESGGWEWWCWSPELGWWYGESEDGKKKTYSPKTTINGPIQFSL
jgi:hypothetical protein